MKFCVKAFLFIGAVFSFLFLNPKAIINFNGQSIQNVAHAGPSGGETTTPPGPVPIQE